MIEGWFLVVHVGYSLSYVHVTAANPNTYSLQRAFPHENLQRRLSAWHDIVEPHYSGYAPCLIEVLLHFGLLGANLLH